MKDTKQLLEHLAAYMAAIREQRDIDLARNALIIQELNEKLQEAFETREIIKDYYSNLLTI